MTTNVLKPPDGATARETDGATARETDGATARETEVLRLHNIPTHDKWDVLDFLEMPRQNDMSK